MQNIVAHDMNSTLVAHKNDEVNDFMNSQPRHKINLYTIIYNNYNYIIWYLGMDWLKFQQF